MTVVQLTCKCGHTMQLVPRYQKAGTVTELPHLIQCSRCGRHYSIRVDDTQEKGGGA